MVTEKMFSKKELTEMGRRTLDLLLESLEAGDTENAARLSRRMHNEFLGMHDLYRDWVTDLLSFIGRKFGDQSLHEALEKTVGGYTRRLSPVYAGKSAKEKVQLLVAGLRGHLHSFDIVEEDEKFVITPHLCGSGQRLIKSRAYEPPTDFLKVEKPQAMTFNRPDFPVYCAHCFFQNISPLEDGKEPLFITEPPIEMGTQPCRILIYKKHL